MPGKPLFEYIKNTIWIKEHPIHFAGFDFYARMTLVRLKGGELFVHSPVSISSEEKEMIDSLGVVKYIVAPSKLHHVLLPSFTTLYPEATTYATTGLQKKRKDLSFHKILTGTPPEEWAEELDQVLMEGNSVLEEVEFYHKATKTLIATDLIEYFPVPPDNANPFMKNMIKLFPRFQKGSASPEFLMCTVNKKAARRSLDKLLSWDMDRAIIAHGELLDGGVKEMILQAYKWVMG